MLARLPPSFPRRFRVLILLASLLALPVPARPADPAWMAEFNRRIEAAARLYDKHEFAAAIRGYEAAFQALPQAQQRGSPQALLALEYQLQVCLESGADPFPRIADWMRAVAASEKLERKDTDARQMLLYEQLTTRLRKARDDSRADVEAEADRLTALLKDRELSPGLVALPQLVRAIQLYHDGRAALAEAAFARCDDVPEDTSVAHDLVAGYWGISSKIATERSRFADAFRDHGRMKSVMDRQWQAADELGYKPDDLRIGQITAHNDLGWLFIRIGDYASAEREFEVAHAIGAQVTSDGPIDGILWTDFHLARLAELRGRYDEAVERLTALLSEIGDRTRQDRLLWSVRNDLAMNLSFAGRLDDALPEFNRALDEARRFGEQDLHFGETLVNRSWLLLELGDAAAAADGFQQAVQIFQQLEEQSATLTPRRSEAQGYLARALIARGGDDDQVRSLVTEAALGRMHYAAQVLNTDLSERDRLAFVTELALHTESPAYPSAFSTYLEFAPQLGISPLEQHRLLRAWSSVLSAVPVAVRTDPRDQRLKSETARLAREVAASYWAEEEIAEQQRAEIIDLDDALSALERKQSQPPAPHSLIDETALAGIAPIELPQGAVLVDFRRMQRHLARQRRPDGSFPPLRPGRAEMYVMFVADSESMVHRIDLASKSLPQVDESIARFTAAIAAQDLVLSGRAELDTLIGEPLRALAPDARLIFVSGERAFHQLPFGALGTPAAYWAESTAFVRVRGEIPTSPANALDPLTSPASWLIVGDVDYGLGDLPISSIPHTRQEAEEVELALTRAATERDSRRQTRLTGSDATRFNVAGALDREVLHLATHGYFRTNAAEFGIYGFSARLDSGLVLAAANQADADAFLTAGEIGYANLRPTRLVVLSACETGLGYSTIARNPIGLVDAIGRAGAQHLIAANWKVPDDVTQRLMAAFYRNLLDPAAQRSIPEALRLAEVEIIQRPDTSDPFNWAAWSDWYGTTAD